MMSTPPLRRLALTLLLLALAACGGGGGGGETGPLPEVDTRAVAQDDPGSTLPANWREGPFAEIFVRAYQDSDGDGIGDLQGLISRLDYLQDLGVTGLWLMPVTASQDADHGYAVSDYRRIERDYGSLADFDALVAAAHARGLGVVIDYVMNHSAARHPAFVNSKAGSGNPFRDWYVWQSGRPSGWNVFGGDPWRNGGSGWYYGAFWDQMPDFNLRNASVVEWHHDNLRFWLNRGVDGFRFDAVGNLVENGPNAWESQPQNYTLMRDVRQLVGGYAQRFVVCESPANPVPFADACGSAFAFGHHGNLAAAAKGDTAAIRAVADYFETAPLTMSTMLSNHDTFAGQRAWDQFGGDPAPYRLAAATLLLMPGTPFIYYGEEIGMAGAAALTGDPKLRTPMSWTATPAGFTSGTPFRAVSANIASQNVAAQLADPNSLLAWYRAMIALRRANPSLSGGSYEAAVVNGSLLHFQRAVAGERSLVLINYGRGNASATVDGLPASSTLSNAFPPSGTDLATDAGGSVTVTVPAQSVRVLVLRS
ncbi:alpha-amylase family glycosyl hydrolase [Piscinibacter defluvii]|uniref:alpha-amylase family glycosyl hydrolase n=1 Tax=Piscinibacter defluvii TaxID=1796922 RepID=UPI001F0C2C98|nr:alpha-amylase family glycosyl hydrolase [Piscinibacter defluvii]